MTDEQKKDKLAKAAQHSRNYRKKQGDNYRKYIREYLVKYRKTEKGAEIVRKCRVNYKKKKQGERDE